MTDLPTGTITFLYTDIEGSTRLWEHQPDAMRRALQRHDAILRGSIVSNGGQVFRTVGDALCAAFPTALQAVGAAAQAQRGLYAEDWALESPLRVRIAIHTGAADLQGGDYVGGSLNRIGRLLPVCHGGQVLLTQAVEQLTRDRLPENARLLDLGQQRFRDLVQPERVFQLVIAGLPERFPPLKTLDAFPNNLPLQVTSFIGRQKELEEVRQRLDSFRLLTLTGPGGTGKTRLALQAAAGDIESFPDGAWLVELAPLADPVLVPQNIASALGLRETPGQPLLELLTDYLRGRSLLLVLDNCEHLIETCAQVADRLLRLCPDVKILVSSREALGIDGEATYRVPPLSLPDPYSLPGLDDLRQYEAVQLFVERAQAVNAQFSLTPQNASAVARICQRLDGIPLALELAAARLKLFSPEQVAARLDDRFRLLTGGSRTALPRQQTLQALIDWSHDLLSEPEKALFRRLSVFGGGWSFEAAEAVCAGAFDHTPAIEPFGVLDLLFQLVNKSMVLADEQGEQARYHFLETVRQYASEKLVASGEAAQVRQRHMLFFSLQAQDTQEGFFPLSPDQFRRVAWLEREQDNLRLVQEWALEHDLDIALQIIAGTSFNWTQRGYGTEALRFVSQVLDRAESRQEYQPGGDPQSIRWLALGWIARATLLMGQGQNQASQAAFDQGLLLSRRIHADDATGVALFLLTTFYQLTDDVEAASASIDEAVAIFRRLGSHNQLTAALLFQAAIVLERSGYSAGRDQFLKAIQQSDRNHNGFGSAMSRMQLAIFALAAADYNEAQRLYQESYALYEQIGLIGFQNICRSGLADVARVNGDFPRAIRLYQETVAVHVVIGNRGGIARCLECLAFIANAQDAGSTLGVSKKKEDVMLRHAAMLFGAADGIREASRSAMRPEERQEYEAQVAELRRLLDREELESAWEAGRALDVERAVALASTLTAGEAARTAH
jgi:predicted ATPase/class 3 adenylate cyclase